MRTSARGPRGGAGARRPAAAGCRPAGSTQGGVVPDSDAMGPEANEAVPALLAAVWPHSLSRAPGPCCTPRRPEGGKAMAAAGALGRPPVGWTSLSNRACNRSPRSTAAANFSPFLHFHLTWGRVERIDKLEHFLVLAFVPSSPGCWAQSQWPCKRANSDAPHLAPQALRPQEKAPPCRRPARALQGPGVRRALAEEVPGVSA